MNQDNRIGYRCDINLVGERIHSLNKDEAAACHELGRVQACGVATGRVVSLSVTRSTSPDTMEQPASPQRMWAVVISSEVDRKALLDRLYPQLTTRNS